MTKLRLRLATFLTTFEHDLTMASPLLFSEVSCLARNVDSLPPRLAARVREIVRSTDVVDLHRRRLAQLPDVRTVRVVVPPVSNDQGRQEPVTIDFTYAYWRHGDDAVIAYVPALDIEVVAADDQRLDSLLVPQILGELGRRKTAQSVRDLVLLERQARVVVRRLTVGVALPTSKQAAQRERQVGGDKKSLLAEIASDLGKSPSPPIYERDALLAQLTELLTGPRPRSVLLVGPSGAGKSALVAELAGPRGPAALADRTVWSTSGSRIVAGQTGYGMWQQRCQQLVREAKRTHAVLHLGNFVELMETGKGGGSTTGIASMLRPAIADGELLAIAECTPEEWALVEREDSQFLEAFATLEVPAATSAQAEVILARLAEASEARGARPIQPAALAEIERLHRRFATYSAAPGRVVRFLQNLMADAPRTPRAAPRFAPPSPPLVAADVIAAFSRETGLPLRMLDDRCSLDLDEVREWLAARVVGQPRPVELVTDLLAAIKSSLARGGKPLASFLFIGPTGVGKTEMAKSLAEFLYQDASRMIRLDMSEYATPAAVARLVGGPDGAPGRLTKEVRDQPFMIVLLDEFEKAHPRVFDILLQVLGEGRLTDARGRLTDFTNAVIIMTSNLGADSYRAQGVGFSSDERRATDADEHFERAVREFLRPELFNRIDRIVSFAPLDRDMIAAIARREVANLTRRDGLRLRSIQLDVSPAAAAWLAARGYEPRYGARPLKRVVERHLVAPLAERICRYGEDVALRCRVDVADERLAIDLEATPRVRDAGAGGEGRAKTIGVADVARAVQTLRRETERVAASGVVLRCRNEIERLRQNEAERMRRWKRKRQARSSAAEPPFGFTPAQAKILSQERSLQSVDAIVRDVRSLEDLTLELLYADQAGSPDELEATRRELADSFRRAVLDLHLVLNPSHGILTLAIFGDSPDRVLELAGAYERLAQREGALVSRFWLTMHDPQRLSAESSTGSRPARGAGSPGPILRLLHRKESSQSPTRRTLDVYAADAEPPPGTVGVALQVRSNQVALLLESEQGTHEFFAPKGGTTRCWVECIADRLVSYEPPADAGRVGAFRELRLRRFFDFARGACVDVCDGEQILPLDGASLDEALEKAVRSGFQRRLGKAFQ